MEVVLKRSPSQDDPSWRRDPVHRLVDRRLLVLQQVTFVADDQLWSRIQKAPVEIS